MGLAGMRAVGFEMPPAKKRLLIFAETDGCFVDGLSAATGCTVGHRTLRVEDYGKMAAVFVNTLTEQALRVAPAPDIRQRAYTYAPGEPRHYFAQLQAYQIMPDGEMFCMQSVELTSSIASIVSRPGVRTHCDICHEEIINEREVKDGQQTLCRACAQGAYYQPILSAGAPLYCSTLPADPVWTEAD